MKLPDDEPVLPFGWHPGYRALPCPYIDPHPRWESRMDGLAAMSDELPILGCCKGTRYRLIARDNWPGRTSGTEDMFKSEWFATHQEVISSFDKGPNCRFPTRPTCTRSLAAISPSRNKLFRPLTPPSSTLTPSVQLLLSLISDHIKDFTKITTM